MWDFPLLPEQASSIAGEVDAVFWFIVAINVFFTVAIYIMVAVLGVRYRRGKQVDRSNPPASNHTLEMIWIGFPLVIVLFLFVWASNVYFQLYRVPPEATTIYAIGKQWMWKFENPEGPREINELHVPLGRKVHVKMISQDVIHSLFFPAFRVKQDVLPGRYTSLWFEATKTGTYHIFCAEYCGTEHSRMIGRVVVMEPNEYEAWLSGAKGSSTPASAGSQLFTSLGCNTCHMDGGGGRGPALAGIYGHEVQLASGETVVADEDYIRESIVNPTAKLVQGYAPLMPNNYGTLSEEEIIQLIEYIKSQASNETTGINN